MPNHIERLKNSERNLEHWSNHYSIMGGPYKSLFQRAGFKLHGSDEIFLNKLKQEIKSLMKHTIGMYYEKRKL